MFNITKNVKDEPTNKLTTSKLITFNGKMSTNNMINSKSSNTHVSRSAKSTPKSLIESVID